MRIYKEILEMQRLNNDKLPYKLVSSLDLSAVKVHYDKIASKKLMIKAVTAIQSFFRGRKARKYFGKLKFHKLKLALNIQKVWRKHFLRIRHK